MEDILILGGGLAGLAAAAWCARSGAKVTLLERAQALGGRARTDREGGHAFNQGGHALYVDGGAMRGLKELGVAWSGRRPKPGRSLAVTKDEVRGLPAGLPSLLATDLLSFGAKVEAARALVAIARADAASLGDATWAEWTHRVATRPEVRAVLDTFSRVTTYAHAPSRMSAAATVAQIRLAADRGVVYLDDGWQTLVDGLERAAIAAGARIARGVQVASLVSDGARLAVTTADGDVTYARAAILAVGPKTAQAILGEPSLGAGLTPARAACLDLGLADLPRPKNVFALGLDAPTYFSVHSATARLGEPGTATISVMKYLDPDAPADARADERELEALVDRLQPGWREVTTARRFLPSLVASNAIVEAGKARPAVDAPRTPGVFLAGDWVDGAGMLADAAIASARTAARAAVDHAARVERPRAREAILGAP